MRRYLTVLFVVFFVCFLTSSAFSRQYVKTPAGDKIEIIDAYDLTPEELMEDIPTEKEESRMSNEIQPGETYGPFDVWIDPPYCYPTLTVIWTLTLDGRVVAGPETSYWHCGPTDTEPATWGTIKALYR